MFINMKILLVSLTLFCLISVSYAGDDQDLFTKEELDNLNQAYCDRSSIEAEIQNSKSDVALLGDVLVKLLSGNKQKAIDQMAFELSLDIKILYEHAKNNKCNAPEAVLKNIYPLIRVIAVINEKTPIPGFDSDKELKSIFEEAIKKDPEHYQKLKLRSKNWDNGIK